MILYLNSSDALRELSGFYITTLVLVCTELKSLRNDSLSGLSTIKYLTIHGTSISSIQERAFHSMTSLIKLIIYYDFDEKDSKHPFIGMGNLKTLVIHSREYRANTEFDSVRTRTKCPNEEVFVGLSNLTNLHLEKTGFTCLKPGSFLVLHQIEEIVMFGNNIGETTHGVFGAECIKKIDISCKNVTLSKYCKQH